MKSVTNTSTSDAENRRFLAEGIMIGGSRAIERQEARGQAELIKSNVIPIKRHRVDDEVLIADGFKLGDPVPDDDQFQYAKLPDGWSMVATDHPMWSKILDKLGRERYAVFYKAASYDRHAHMSRRDRFTVDRDWERTEEDGRMLILIHDAGQLIHSFEAEAKEGEKIWDLRDRLVPEGEAWLDEHRPGWREQSAWDREYPA